ncbi:nucleotidyltransferase domain-containing protein [Marinobacterium marinum]|uniref:Nucleotidyltransferase domain-containing protein n=1 Tax=Marinobacterium marinum TaxID=2756129 RepID=A0A7W1WYM6_9GAMM|nr:nucleotidyltransferase domain-containing protein [Marinobacterium marinum]MBA4502640.1 nucleotidyltransferase domain-containing protein [Marinobacterium marinum]
METRIEATLDRVEQEQGVRILYACEAGSRAWGMASPGSDYDVRFIYIGRMEDYLTIGKRRDVIGPLIVQDLDLHGWDLAKALGLLRNSNPTLYEWLNSSRVYRADVNFVAELRNLAERALQPGALFHHYLSMAAGQAARHLQSDTVTAKRYLHVVRPLLCALWVSRYKTPPPALFTTLVKTLVECERVNAAIRELLMRKSAGGTAQSVGRLTVLDEFIACLLIDLKHAAPAAIEKPGIAPFDVLLQRTLLEEKP